MQQYNCPYKEDIDATKEMTIKVMTEISSVKTEVASIKEDVREIRKKLNGFSTDMVQVKTYFDGVRRKDIRVQGDKNSRVDEWIRFSLSTVKDVALFAVVVAVAAKMYGMV